MAKIKKIISGGIYWVNFNDARIPEWGNTIDNKPHLWILFKVENFMSREMYLAFPCTSNEFYIKTYSKKIVTKITFNNKEHYVLVNQVRTISKSRVVGEYKDIDDNVVKVKEIEVNKLKDLYINWVNNILR